jgi:hypothetical protein
VRPDTLALLTLRLPSMLEHAVSTKIDRPNQLKRALKCMVFIFVHLGC